MTRTNYSTLTASIIVAWFLFSLIAAAFHLYVTKPQQPPLPLLFAVLIPIAVFSIWYFGSASFREFVLSLDSRALTSAQGLRVAGFTFVVLYVYKILPGVFALPAGWGDMAIGATAALAAARLANPARRTWFILWQLLGVTDLVLAVSLGAGAAFIRPGDLLGPSPVSTQPMTLLPLSLIPTFIVPLCLILHSICIAQARRWPRQNYNPLAKEADWSAA